MRIILCAGQNGRCVLYGTVEKPPKPGEAVLLRDARMVLYFPSGGLLGIAAKGPPDGTKITHAVPSTLETVWQEWIEVTPEAVEAIDAYKPIE